MKIIFPIHLGCESFPSELYGKYPYYGRKPTPEERAVPPGGVLIPDPSPRVASLHRIGVQRARTKSHAMFIESFASFPYERYEEC